MLKEVKSKNESNLFQIWCQNDVCHEILTVCLQNVCNWNNTVSYFQLVDKLNTNTEIEEMINEYNIVSTPGGNFCDTWINSHLYQEDLK